jgi:hypothetical protein
MEASVTPFLFAPVIDSESDDAEAALAAQIAWGTSPGVSTAAAPRVVGQADKAEAATPRARGRDYPDLTAGMAVWEDEWPDAGSLRPAASSGTELEAQPPGPALSALDAEIARDCDEELALPLVHRRAAHGSADGSASARTRPTLPADVADAGTDAMRRAGDARHGAREADPRSARDIPLARVGSVRVNLPSEERDRLVRLRPPQAAPSLRGASPGGERARVVSDQSAPRHVAPQLAPRTADADRKQPVDEDVREEPITVRERPHLHRGLPSKHDAELPSDRVQAAPIVAVPDAIPLVNTAPLRPLEARLDTDAANGHPDEPAANAMPYQIVRLDDRHARVELVHPELGRVEVDVRTDAGRVDVELLAKSLTSSIALRAGEESLRGEMRQRGATLRNYRVRTLAESVARKLDEETR